MLIPICLYLVAIVFLNSSLESYGKYEFLGTSTGNNAVTFNANDYNELYVNVDVDGTGAACLFAVVPVLLLSDTPRSFVASGGFQMNGYGKYCNIYISHTSAIVNYVRNDSVDTINSVKISVYGKK